MAKRIRKLQERRRLCPASERNARQESPLELLRRRDSGRPSSPSAGRLVLTAKEAETADKSPTSLNVPWQCAAWLILSDSTALALMLLSVNDRGKPIGHAFLSYVREDSEAVDRLQHVLEAAGIPVWRDTDTELWPGDDWQRQMRQAITRDALVFIACFSSNSTRRTTSFQNEELTLAIDQFRVRNPDVPWLLPVRLDDCVIPDINIGGGRTLASIQRADLFGERRDKGIASLVAAILRILHPGSDISASAYYSCFLSYSAQDTPFVRKLANDLSGAGISFWLDSQEIRFGEPIEQGIRRGLSSQDKMLLVLSRFSVASRWVDKELRIALSLERERGKEVVFPLRLDRSVFEASSPLLDDLIRTRHIGDFEGWEDEAEYSKQLRRLVRDLTISASLDLERGR